MPRKELKYIKDEQPTDGHVLPGFAQNFDLEAHQLQGRYTGKPFLSTDGVIQQDGNVYEVQSSKRVDIVAKEIQGQTVFEKTSDALSVAELTGFDPRDYATHPLSDADEIDRASVRGSQVSSVKKHGASRKYQTEKTKGRIKEIAPKK